MKGRTIKGVYRDAVCEEHAGMEDGSGGDGEELEYERGECAWRER